MLGKGTVFLHSKAPQFVLPTVAICQRTRIVLQEAPMCRICFEEEPQLCLTIMLETAVGCVYCTIQGTPVECPSVCLRDRRLSAHCTPKFALAEHVFASDA
jgi:hypothetical protein